MNCISCVFCIRNHKQFLKKQQYDNMNNLELTTDHFIKDKVSNNLLDGIIISKDENDCFVQQENTRQWYIDSSDIHIDQYKVGDNIQFIANTELIYKKLDNYTIFYADLI